MEYRPTMSERRLRDLRRWHERAYREMASAGERRVAYLGLDLLVPSTVFGPTPTSDLLGQAVTAETDPTDRVLDMGTGSGVNAILAARQGAEVVGVDLNPTAVDAARLNAERNDVRALFKVSDIYSAVDGTFDLMIIDPPFRWFTPRDMTEAAATDEGYRGVARFFAGVDQRLRPGGRILLFFGTSGDQEHVVGLAERSGLRPQVVASRDLTQDDVTVTYSTFRLERADSLSEDLSQPRGRAG
ncbi:methyltransferase [Pseudonocardia kongjuensis]